MADNAFVRSNGPVFDRLVLAVFGFVGVIWVVGLAVFVLTYSQPLVSVPAAYVVVFASALASNRFHSGVVLLAAWAVAVLAMSVLVFRSDALIGEALFLGGFAGTGLFGLWVVPSYLLLLGIDSDRRDATGRDGTLSVPLCQ